MTYNSKIVKETANIHGTGEVNLTSVLPDVHGWQPISTAPRDRFIFVYCPEDNSRWLVKWQGGEWYGTDAEHGIRRTGYSFGDPNVVTGWAVTHWMETPKSPVLP